MASVSRAGVSPSASSSQLLQELRFRSPRFGGCGGECMCSLFEGSLAAMVKAGPRGDPSVPARLPAGV